MLDFIIDILIGTKYGFGSVAWGCASGACLVVSLLLFDGGHPILGGIALAGCIVCLVKEIRQFCADIKYKQYKKKMEDMEKNKATQ
jgi:hypothetical protein